MVYRIEPGLKQEKAIYIISKTLGEKEEPSRDPLLPEALEVLRYVRKFLRSSIADPVKIIDEFLTKTDEEKIQ